MKNTINKRKCVEKKKEKKRTNKLRESKIVLFFFFKPLSLFSITLPKLVNTLIFIKHFNTVI